MDKILIGICIIDRPKTTVKCLNQLIQHTDMSQVELVIINNNSNHATEKILGQYEEYFYAEITNSFNVGVAFGTNQWLSFRKSGQTVLKIDADAHILVDDWLPAMLKIINYPDIGCACGRRPTLWYDQGRWEGYKKDVVVERRDGIFIENVNNSVIGPWWMIKGEVIDQIGYMNEALGIDDIEYAPRVNALGLKNVYLPDVAILQPHNAEKQEHLEYQANRACVTKHWINYLNEITGFQYGDKDFYRGSRFIEGSITDPEYQKRSDANWEFFKNWRTNNGKWNRLDINRG